MQCCSQPFVGATHLQMGNWQVIAPEPSPCSARARGPKARISSALDATADIEVATLWTPIRISGMLVDYSQNTIQGLRMSAPSAISRFDRAFFVRLADWVAASVAIALPWSTSAVGIAIAAWLVVLLPTLDAAAVKRELGTAAGGLPVVLWCMGLVGMLWADVSWHDRFAGLDGFHRLLVFPILLAQFRRSENGIWVVRGFFLSSVTVLIASYVILVIFGQRFGRSGGVPVHVSIFQGSLFLICGFGAIGYAVLARRKEDGR